MNIDYGVKFLLKELVSGDIECFVLQSYTTNELPKFTGNIRCPIGYTTNITSNGGQTLEDNTVIITDNSPLGEKVLGKSKGNILNVSLINGKQIKYLVLAVGKSEILNYLELHNLSNLSLINEYNLYDFEIENKNKLLNFLNEKGFIGFLHTANFDNFIRIYQSGFLKSRKQLEDENIIFEDNAESAVLDKTLDDYKSKVRFYYRPITPTNISAYLNHGQKRPVLMVFNKDLIFNEDVLFCDGCAGSKHTKTTKNEKEAFAFKWDDIFSVGPFNSDDFLLKNHRNAEFLVSMPISINNVIKFYFKNYSDYVSACNILGKDDRFEFDSKFFY